MQLILQAVDWTLAAIRGGALAVAGTLALVCGVDWLVRTRKLNPFGPVARFMRSTVDPLLKPVERRVVRAGGLPSSAPIWALAIALLAGIILISLLQFLHGQIVFFFSALEAGPRGFYRLLVTWTCAVLQIALLVRVVLSWFRPNPGAWYVRWAFRLTEPFLAPLRRVIPSVGMMDITPIVAWFLLGLIQSALLWLV
jgi:YggT family protein